MKRIQVGTSLISRLERSNFPFSAAAAQAFWINSQRAGMLSLYCAKKEAWHCTLEQLNSQLTASDQATDPYYGP